MSDKNLDIVFLQAMIQSGAIRLVPVPAFTGINKVGYINQINRNVQTMNNALVAIRNSLKLIEEKEKIN